MFGLEFRKKMTLAAHLNLAMCHIKMEDFQKAIQQSDEVLKIEPNNEKGHFRKATVSFIFRTYHVKDYFLLFNFYLLQIN